MANLLLLADILEAADAMHRANGEPTFNQGVHTHDCGTPSCALSHWYAYKGSTWLDGDIDEVLEEFALTPSESVKLFAGDGCGGARTAQEAAGFIRRFVADRSGGEQDSTDHSADHCSRDRNSTRTSAWYIPAVSRGCSRPSA